MRSNPDCHFTRFFMSFLGKACLIANFPQPDVLGAGFFLYHTAKLMYGRVRLI
jgi:hypothetical protein